MACVRVPGTLGLFCVPGQQLHGANSTPAGAYCAAGFANGAQPLFPWSDPFALDPGTLALTVSPMCGPVGVVSQPPAQNVAAERSAILTDPIKLDTSKFYELYSKESAPFGVLSAERRDGLNEVLGFIQADGNLKSVYWIAYMLATLMHECRSAASKWLLTWKPVSETGGDKMDYGKEVVVTNWDGTPVGSDGTALTAAEKPDPQSTEKVGKHSYLKSALVRKRYYGRGYVQITHMDNYRAMDDALDLKGTLLADPDKALDPTIAYNIMSYGMREGSFRGSRKRNAKQGYYGGHKMSDYLAGSSGYEQARAIINGDGATHGATIAGYAQKFEKIIQASRTA